MLIIYNFAYNIITESQGAHYYFMVLSLNVLKLFIYFIAHNP